MQNFIKTIINAIKFWVKDEAFNSIDALQDLAETDMLPAVHDKNGKILTDENGKIILRY